MPKTIKFEKRDNRRVRVVVATKFRIGTRKTGTSANLMSSKDLVEVLTNPDKAKWHNSAKSVLANRV